MSASVVYAVSDSHLAKLSEIDYRGEATLHRGQARFLAAICPEVWPNMRLRVGERIDGGCFADPQVRVTALRLFTLIYSMASLVSDSWIRNRSELWAESEEDAKAELTAQWKEGRFSFLSVERGNGE